MSNVAINIAAEFTGKPAFKKAESSVDKLNKSTKSLGKTLTRTFGTAAVLAFGRASVKAFAEDDKAATALGTTLKNLNLAYGSNIGTVNGYISRLEASTGVLDDELRPAMDRLLRATGDVAKSQELLNLALDVAAGTGKSVTQVSQSLQKAYLGQTQALGRLGVGLSKAELTSSSFEEIQQRLTTLFAGQAQAAAETFAGQLDKLTIAANNAKETIGKGLYDAITALSGGGATAATDNIDKLANGIADTVSNAGKLLGKLEDLKPVLIAVGVVAAAAFLPLTTAIAGAIWLMGDLNKRLDEQSFRKGIIPNGLGNISMTVSGQVDNRTTKQLAAAQTKAAKESAKAQKESLKLAKAKAIFDLQKIQIEAALKGKISAEDEIRLKLMKAIEEENLTAVEKYQKALETAQTKTKELTELLTTVKTLELKDPFGEWKIDPLTAAINALTTSIGGVGTQIQASGREWSSFANLVASTIIRPNLSEWSSSFSSAAASASAATASANAGLASTTAAATKAAQDAAAASAAAIAAANKASTDAIAAAQASAKSALEKLNAEAAANTAAATKAAQDAIDAANKTAQETVASILAKSSAAAAAAAAAAAIGTVDTTTLAGVLAASGTTGGAAAGDTNVTITVNTGIGDPNAIAEEIQKILDDAHSRGALVGGLYAD